MLNEMKSASGGWNRIPSVPWGISAQRFESGTSNNRSWIILVIMFICLISVSGFAQDITNTLGPGGVFKIKDAATDFLTLSQSTGQVNILKTLRLENTNNSTTGVIFKGTNRFIHNYYNGTSYNTFLGVSAGNFTLTTANENTGIGYSSLLSLTTGDYNTALGRSALEDNTTGYSNTAVGYFSLSTNTSGYQNTAVGDYSLFTNSTGVQNTAVGYYSLYANTTSNYNTAMGYSSLYFNTTGYENTAIGCLALYSNTIGYNNTALGYSALQANNSGFSNTAVGRSSLISNSSGHNNTALGQSSLYANTTGYENTAVGRSALSANTTGHNNTALGRGSLFSNIIGNYNTAVGDGSLENNTNSGNTALGYQSLYMNTTGHDNLAAGRQSLNNNTTGYNNTALGYGTGSIISTGSNLTCLGFDAEPTSASATNQITLGNSSVTSLRCAVTTISALSDARDKKNIKDLDLGIDFLLKIKPRIYNWDKREWYENNVSDGSKMKEEPTAGFIAQELDEAQKQVNAAWLNLVLKDNPEKWEATPGNLLPIIVKAIQELKAEKDLEIAKLKSENVLLKNNNDKLSAEVASLKYINERLTSLEQTINKLTTNKQTTFISTNMKEN